MADYVYVLIATIVVVLSLLGVFYYYHTRGRFKTKKFILTNAGFRRHKYLAKKWADRGENLPVTEQNEMDVLDRALDFNIDDTRERKLTANDGIDPRYNEDMRRLSKKRLIMIIH